MAMMALFGEFLKVLKLKVKTFTHFSPSAIHIGIVGSSSRG
jgi:hypothetical protein